ncbi:TPA: hypothetical protein ACH3X2_14308 [Trebouxia sp. C0005]
MADSTSIHLQTVSQMLHPAEGCMYSVQNPREGSLSLAWDSSGSLLAVCTAMGRLRLYHDQGRHCTLLDLAEHVLEVVFTPGDPSMMYCIRSRGISLLNLKALPECAAFCQAGEQKLRPTTAAYKGSGYQAAVLCDPGCVGPTGCEDPIASSWLPPVAPTPSVPQARTASRSGASDGSSRQPPGSSASGVRPQTDAPVSTFNTHPQLCHEAPSPGSTHPSLHSDSPDGQPMACSLSLCAAEVPESHPSCHPAISLGCPGASDNQQHCHGKSALPLQDIQLTYGSRKRQRTAGHCSGSGAKQKQTADYAWLQGADETPSAAPHHQGSQAYKSSTLWCNLEAEQMTAAEASSSRAENPDNTDATLIWQVPSSLGHAVQQTFHGITSGHPMHPVVWLGCHLWLKSVMAL